MEATAALCPTMTTPPASAVMPARNASSTAARGEGDFAMGGAGHGAGTRVRHGQVT